MKAVVMAGGEGTRLRPLTCNLPKPMVPVMDKPVMEYSLHLLKKYGIQEVAVTLQYLPNAISGYFGSGHEWDMNIRYFLEDTPLGTAGSVKNAQEFLDETFIVISGDALTDFPLDQAIEFHQSRKALVTLVLTRVESPLEYGLVLTDKQGRITRFLEKPSWGEVFSDTVNTGIYILEPEVLEYIPPGLQYDFSRDLFPRLLSEKQPMYACVLDGYWCDIGNCLQYRQVHIDILQGKVNIDLEGERRGEQIIGTGTHISPRARLEGPLYIGEGCEIEAGARIQGFTVLSRGTTVESRASLKRAVVWSGACIGQASEIRGAIIGKGARIKEKCSVFENAVVGDNCLIEDQVVIQPDVKIWPYKVIESGRVVTESLVWADQLPRSIFTQHGIAGDLHSQMTPEKLARLGRALGSHLKVGARVILGRDKTVVAQAASMALSAGLMISGVEVIDAGQVLLPVLRFAVRTLDADMGFYLGLSGDQRMIALRLIGPQGVDLLKTEERKIENVFYRGEYRALSPVRLRSPRPVPDLKSAYLRNLKNHIDSELLSSHHLKVVVGADYLGASNLITELFDSVGVTVIRVDGQESPEATGYYDREVVLDNIKHTVRRKGVDLGILLEDGGQKVTLVAPDGTVIQDERFMALISGSIGTEFGTVFLPVNAPVTLEKHIQKQGQKVVRTRAFFGEFMREMLKAGENEQMMIYADGLYATLKIMEFMARHDYSLNDLLDRTPEFHLVKQDIPVSWADKGRVIRRLAEEYPEVQGEEALGGIRLNHENATSLIMPDEDRPLCRIYVEAFSQEIAESLTDFYRSKIENICQETEGSFKA